jgi:peroxiredoxin
MPLHRGDPAPWFKGRSPANDQYNFSSVGGRYVVVAFIGSAGSEKGKAFWDTLLKHRTIYNDKDACIFVVSNDPADESEGRLQNHAPGIRIFWDFNNDIANAFKVFEGENFVPQTLVLDWRLRVLANQAISNPVLLAEKLQEYVQDLPKQEKPVMANVQAPILVVPNVFEPEFCELLIQHYQTEGGLDSGYMKEIDGKTVGVYDYSIKRRSDCIIKDQNIINHARERIVRRLLPEVKKAFQFDTGFIERYIVACYESETKGFFNPHRDNTSKGTAHRRFAVTLNLNAEGYEGGNLRFPEFGQQLYRAPTGGAVVFSCSLLHEATPVTRGTRYVFLPFIYDEAGEKIRQENLKYVVNGNEAAGEEATEKQQASV